MPLRGRVGLARGAGLGPGSGFGSRLRLRAKATGLPRLEVVVGSEPSLWPRVSGERAGGGVCPAGSGIPASDACWGGCPSSAASILRFRATIIAVVERSFVELDAVLQSSSPDRGLAEPGSTLAVSTSEDDSFCNWLPLFGSTVFKKSRYDIFEILNSHLF